MPDSIERSRYGCNLHGALQTLSVIEGVVPIVHSTPGCGIQNYISNSAGGNSAGYLTGYSVPNSNVYEKQVIFGGTSRLREQIKNAVKVIKGDLYVTLSGCEAEMVGDDIISMTQEIVNQGESAIYYKAPGFKGDQHIGYEGVVDALITQLSQLISTIPEKEAGLVNILGIIPKQDLYWQGNLDEIERILGNVNVEVNKLFGYSQTIENWNRVPLAQLNIVVSKWGIKAAEKLKEIYGTPYITVEDIGIGAEEIEEFLWKIGEALGLQKEQIESYLSREKERFTYNLKQITEYYYDYDFQRNAVLVGDESTILRYGRFLTKYFGMEIEAAIITDYTGEEGKQVPNPIISEIAQEVYYERDSRSIDKIISNTQVEIIFGSGLENQIAGKLKIPNFIISYPAYGKVIITKKDLGYEGASNIIEELSSYLIQNRL
jgi:nitrogenase molybdenum-iron protein beta chain